MLSFIVILKWKSVYDQVYIRVIQKAQNPKVYFGARYLKCMDLFFFFSIKIFHELSEVPFFWIKEFFAPRSSISFKSCWSWIFLKSSCLCRVLGLLHAVLFNMKFFLGKVLFVTIDQIEYNFRPFVKRELSNSELPVLNCHLPNTLSSVYVSV